MEGDPQWQEQGTGGTGFAVSEYSLNLRKKTYVVRSKPLAIGGEELGAEQQLVDKMRQQRKNDRVSSSGSALVLNTDLSTGSPRSQR